MKEYLSYKPQEVEKVAEGRYIKRSNIIEVEHEADPTTGEEAYTSWECDAEFISEADLILAKQSDIEERQSLAEDVTAEILAILGGE